MLEHLLVVYNGKTCHDEKNGIAYLNAMEFLTDPCSCIPGMENCIPGENPDAVSPGFPGQ